MEVVGLEQANLGVVEGHLQQELGASSSGGPQELAREGLGRRLERLDAREAAAGIEGAEHALADLAGVDRDSIGRREERALPLLVEGLF